jgi:hypothetical protein
MTSKDCRYLYSPKCLEYGILRTSPLLGLRCNILNRASSGAIVSLVAGVLWVLVWALGLTHQTASSTTAVVALPPGAVVGSAAGLSLCYYSY